MSDRPDHLTPLTDAEERLLRAILLAGKAWETDPRTWLARLLATLDDERANADRMEERLLLASERTRAIDHPCHEACVGDLHADCQCGAYVREQALLALRKA